MVDNGYVHWVVPSGGRDTWSLITSCLSTILLCTWSAMHLNIPSDNTSFRKRMLMQAVWMLVAIVAPEYVATFGIRRWYEDRWSLEEINVVLKPRVSEGMRDVLVGIDNLACPFGRGETPLASETELVESAQAVEGSVTDSSIPSLCPVSNHVPKPWTIQHASFVAMGGFNIVYKDGTRFRLNSLQFLALLRARRITLPDVSKDEIMDKSKANLLMKAWLCAQLLWFLSKTAARAIERLPVSSLELFTLGIVCCTTIMYIGFWTKPQGVEIPMNILTDYERGELQDLLHPNQIDRTNDGRKVGLDDYIDRQIIGMRYYIFLILVPTMAFGACHMLGWASPYPSRHERDLWRLGSVACLVLPLILISLGELAWTVRGARIAICPTLVTYVIARTYLFVEMFLALRSCPAAMYDDVNWAKYFIHFGS